MGKGTRNSVRLSATTAALAAVEKSNFRKDIQHYRNRNALTVAVHELRQGNDLIHAINFHDVVDMFKFDDRKPEWKLINPFYEPRPKLLDNIGAIRWGAVLARQIENKEELDRAERERNAFVEAVEERNGYKGYNLEQCKLIMKEYLAPLPLRVVRVHHQYEGIVQPQILDLIHRPINNISSDTIFHSLRDMVKTVLKNTLLNRALIFYCPYYATGINRHEFNNQLLRLDTNVVLKALGEIPSDTDDFSVPWDTSTLDKRLVRGVN